MPPFPLGPLFLSVQTVGLRGEWGGRVDGWEDGLIMVTVGRVEDGRRREYAHLLGVKALATGRQGMARKETRACQPTTP